MKLTDASSKVDKRFDHVDQRFDEVDKRFESIDNDLGRLKGDNREVRYRERPFVYFSKIIRKARTFSLDTLQQLLEQALEQGQLTQAKADDIALSDVIVQGINQATGTQVRLAVEVSWGIGLIDVERAARRAALLSRLGIPAFPVVAGTRATPEAQAEAQRQQVWLITNGSTIAPV